MISDNEMDIMFGDLTEEAQKELLKFLRIQDPSEENFEVFPVVTLYRDDEF